MNPNSKNFEHKLCLTYMCKLQFWQANANDRIHDIQNWLNDRIGEDNFIFGFEDYGQHGEWMLYTASREDLLAFKLRWTIC